MLTEYELERQRRIEENQKRLRELVDPELLLQPADGPAEPRAPSKRRARPRPSSDSDDAAVGERRVSSRLLGVQAPSYAEREPTELTHRPRRARAGHERGEYGVEGADSCHSCRQKTTSLKARCTTCPIKWCVACLRIRYGEDAVEANSSGSWRCGRCRGCCLCSACRRKAGKQPTGVLGPTATTNGYASVMEMLM